METYTRVREKGTVETMAGNPQDRIGAFRAIVANKQYAIIDGCMIDLFSASAVCNVYDALNEVNRAKFASFKAPVMAQIAFKLIK